MNDPTSPTKPADAVEHGGKGAEALRNSATAQARLLLLLLFGALMLQSLAWPVALRMYDAEWPDAPAIAAMGLAFAQVGLAALVLVLASGPLAVRGAAAILLYGGSAVLATSSVGESLPAWLGIMLCALGIVATPFVLARLAGVAVMPHVLVELPRGSRQYTILGLLVLTTLVAVLLAIGRQLDFPWRELRQVLLFSVAIAAVPCAIGPLACSRVPWPVTLIAILTLCPATGIVLAFTGFPPEHPVELVAMCLVQGAVIFAACLVTRVAGYRLAGPWER
jgi:hypothetical protein